MSTNIFLNSLAYLLVNKAGSHCFQRMIDQRLHLFHKPHCVWQANMIIESGLIYPARVDVEKPQIPDRVECMNIQATWFLSCGRNDFAQGELNSGFLIGESVKACKNEQFHDYFSMLKAAKDPLVLHLPKDS
jgi:hypothetical protein